MRTIQIQSLYTMRLQIMQWESEEELYMGWVCDWDPANSWLKPSVAPAQFQNGLDIQFTSSHFQMKELQLESTIYLQFPVTCYTKSR